MSPDERDAFWTRSGDEQLVALQASRDGLTSQEAARRLAVWGPNRVRSTRERSDAAMLLGQFRSPIILILIAAAALSAFLGDSVDAAIIIAIVAVSGVLTFWQERGAADAVKRLLDVVRVRANTLRDSREVAIAHEDLVPGDVLLLSAGATIPADCLLLESTDLFVDEATLTGESFPTAKQAGPTAAASPITGRSGAVFMGTHVVSGAARAVVVVTGPATEFGSVAQRLASVPPETDFEHGVRRFGYLLMEMTLLLVIAIFAINVFLHKPVIDSFLFSLALAVGLTPQLLPAIISINLAHGARRMARSKVIVKRLDAIEDFGSMDVLCSDKTGTLTEGVVTLSGAWDVRGNESEDVLLYAYLNSFYETGFTNPIDAAIRAARRFDLTRVTKLDEEPYDFVRKRLTVLVEREGRPLMVTKGAFSNVMEVCTHARTPTGSVVRLDEVRSEVERLFQDLSARGYRTLGVAIRDDLADRVIDTSWERDMTLVGVVAFLDPLKAGAAEAVERLKGLGIRLCVITGDNAAVARTISKQMGLETPSVLTGVELRTMHEMALVHRVSTVDIFAEIEPDQKERLVRALKKAGHVVGYLGDGINDASALHAADVGISVNSAVDVAKESADIVLLEAGLDVLEQGVRDGRATFANTLKYVFMATSANFGNMFSMAGASLFLPFLPLLPTQILLTNLLTDFPEMTIASDDVDAELVERPRRWDIGFIRRFMVVFGLLSSIFDYLTFGALLWVMRLPVWSAGSVAGHAQALFRTGWFVESVLSASMVVLVIRTRRPLFRSRPGKLLAAATAVIWAVTLAIPYTPVGALFKFVPLPWPFLLMLAVILAAYLTGAELAKRAFYRREDGGPGTRSSADAAGPAPAGI